MDEGRKGVEGVCLLLGIRFYSFLEWDIYKSQGSSLRKSILMPCNTYICLPFSCLSTDPSVHMRFSGLSML